MGGRREIGGGRRRGGGREGDTESLLKPVLATLLTASVAIPAVARDGPSDELVNLGHG